MTCNDMVQRWSQMSQKLNEKQDDSDSRIEVTPIEKLLTTVHLARV